MNLLHPIARASVALARAFTAFGNALHQPAKRDGFSSSAGNYAGGQINRLNMDWIPSETTGDAAIRGDLRLLRARCRELERDTDYARKFFSVLENDVIGHEGIALEMKILDPDGTSDTVANRTIRDGWERWGRSENCTVAGDDDFLDVQNLILRSTARDGGMLVRKVINRTVNEFGFALQLIEIDYLDINYSTLLPSGNFVFMGVEKTPDTKRIVGYYLLKRHPGETYFGSAPYNRYFVPADEIVHYFVKERSTQSVGVPWLCAPMTRLNMLRGYEEAELAAARAASIKGGFFRSSKGEQYAGEKNSDGSTMDDLSPGQNDVLPAGMDYIPYDPKHPMSQYPEHVKAQLRGAASGMGISYATLTGDLAEANFAAGRMGWLEEREQFKKIQSHLIRKLIIPVFEPWLECALLTQAFNHMGATISLPMSKYDKFNKPHFRGRRWPWIDPQGDITESLTAIDGGLGTRTAYLEEHPDSGDYDDTLATLAEEKKKADKAGVIFQSPSKGGGSPMDAQAPAKPAKKPAPAPDESDQTKSLETAEEEQPVIPRKTAKTVTFNRDEKGLMTSAKVTLEDPEITPRKNEKTVTFNRDTKGLMTSAEVNEQEAA